MQLHELVREVRIARNELPAIKKILRQELGEEQLVACGEQPAPVTALYKEDGLLILRVVFEPGRTTVPHNHRTWSVVGIYRGQEDNKLFRRLPTGGIELTTGRSLTAGDVLALGPGAIHSIRNPRSEPLIALHVYGADMLSQGIIEWDPLTMTERVTSFPPTMTFE
jgi:predicted metal-dependent enzyme (double-stranded beta helix superfamily)